jgi:hypothetical protein
MSQYSIHFVNRYGQTSVHPEALDCRDDAQATERARAFVCAEDLELWEGRRLVELLPSEKPPSQPWTIQRLSQSAASFVTTLCLRIVRARSRMAGDPVRYSDVGNDRASMKSG